MSAQIMLDSRGPYYSESEIQGKLICHFASHEKIRGIKLRAYGDEHTEWWGTESYYNDAEKKYETRSVLYTGDNNVFSWKSMLLGGNSGEIHVGPGTFTYPFSLRLPSNLPSTFKNSYGYIKYKLKGTVDIPWAPDYEDKVYFVVISQIDLNKFPPECFQPTSLFDEKTVCCWCRAGGEISVNINIYKTAFIPGEGIKLYVALTNMSNSNVDYLEVTPVRHIRSHVRSPSHETKHDKIVLASDSWSGVGAHGENEYDIELPIPANISVPNLNRSSLFEVSYDVEITANIPGCHTDIDLSFSVNLGHIQHNNQIPRPAIVAPPDSPPAYPGAPPSNVAPPTGAPYPMPQPTAPAGPAFAPPAQYSDEPPNYSVSMSEKPFYPTGLPSAPNLEEQEACENQRGGPSAPPAIEQPPPSYEDITKKIDDNKFNADQIIFTSRT